MSFAVGVAGVSKEEFDSAVDALDGGNLNSEAAEFLSTAKGIAKEVALKFDNPDANVSCSINGHGCGPDGDGTPYDSLSISVFEVPKPATQ